MCGVGNEPIAGARGRDFPAKVTNPLGIIDRERQETRRATKQLTTLPHRRLSGEWLPPAAWIKHSPRRCRKNQNAAKHPVDADSLANLGHVTPTHNRPDRGR